MAKRQDLTPEQRKVMGERLRAGRLAKKVKLEQEGKKPDDQKE